MRRHWKKRLKQRLRLPFEWLGILLGLAVLSPLPHRAMLAVCDFLAAVMHAFDRKGRALALANLRLVLASGGGARPAADEPPTPRERLLVRGSYRNMARTVGHVFWTTWRAGPRARGVARLDARTQAFLAANRPAVTVSAHLGCWEVLSQLVHLEGHRMTSVAKDIGTPAMTRLLMRSRRSIGQEIVPAAGAFPRLMAALRAGGDVGLLVDQVVKPAKGGLWVRFFGQPVPVSVAPAFLSAKAHAPILIAWSRPLRDGTYRCEYVSAHPWEKGVDIWRLTQRCAAEIERLVRRHPSRWVLNYRYFRIRPTEADLATLAKREGKESS